MMSLVIFILVQIGLSIAIDAPINIDLLTPSFIVEKKFLSVSIDSSRIEHSFRWVNMRNPKLLALAKAMTSDGVTPEMYLRFGGTISDFVKFDPNTYKSFDLNTTTLQSIFDFANNAQWQLIFGLNVLSRYPDNTWDPTNSVQLIDYALNNNQKVHYELGNEPDLFKPHQNIDLPPEQLAKDFKTLREILTLKSGTNSMLIGPDIATLCCRKYFDVFLSNVEPGVLDAITFHHYYSPTKGVTLLDFVTPQYLDKFIKHATLAISIIQNSITTFDIPPIWVGETSSTYDSGKQKIGESFASGFLWLEKLGAAAQLKISVVIRQSLIGGFYSLLNKYYEPTPDYWISVLHKKLVGTRVLNVEGSLDFDRVTRVYAHCINKLGGSNYKASSVVLMAMNLHPTESASLRFVMAGWENFEADLYLFEPANGQLEDTEVKLNGNLLRLGGNNELPELTPVRVPHPYVLPPQTYAYLVIDNIDIQACEEP